MRHASKVLFGLATITLFPALYIASVGPAHWLSSYSWISGDAYWGYSQPAWWLMEAVGLYEAYVEYVWWWTGGTSL
jgi:hypothetical protein